jgi:hypothetical protein
MAQHINGSYSPLSASMSTKMTSLNIGSNPSVWIRTGPHTIPSAEVSVVSSSRTRLASSRSPNRFLRAEGRTIWEASVSTRASHRIFLSGETKFSIFTEATILPLDTPPMFFIIHMNSSGKEPLNRSSRRMEIIHWTGK